MFYKTFMNLNKTLFYSYINFSIPIPKVNLYGGWVNLVSITIPYDSESSRVISKASPFIKLTSKCSKESQIGSDKSTASTFHWNVGLIQSLSTITPSGPLVSKPNPSPGVSISSMVKATFRSSEPSPSISIPLLKQLLPHLLC